MEHRTVKVKLSWNVNYPDVYITRNGIKTEYRVYESDLIRLQKLFANASGGIYVDIENSTVELYSAKGETK